MRACDQVDQATHRDIDFDVNEPGHVHVCVCVSWFITKWWCLKNRCLLFVGSFFLYKHKKCMLNHAREWENETSPKPILNNRLVAVWIIWNVCQFPESRLNIFICQGSSCEYYSHDPVAKRFGRFYIAKRLKINWFFSLSIYSISMIFLRND